MVWPRDPHGPGKSLAYQLAVLRLSLRAGLARAQYRALGRLGRLGRLRALLVDELGELIQELKTSGRHDSSGRFTLDLQRALRKLEQVRLPGKHDYLLCLVTAATLSGARQFSLATGPKQLEITFDGRPFLFEELEALFPGLLEETTEPRLRELGVGLHAARAHAPRSVLLESGGARLELRGTQVQLEPLREPPPMTRIVITQRFSQSLARWWSKTGDEAALLHERCCYGPLAVRVDDRLVEPPRASLLIAHRFEHDEPLRLAVMVAQERSSTGIFHGLCGFAPGGNPASLLFVLNGVAYPQPAEGFPPGFWAWISSPAWRRDLSLSSLVQDATWQRDLDTLHTSAKHLLIQYAETAPFVEPLSSSLLWLLQKEQLTAEALPLFALDGGSERATLRDLRACQERHGELFVRLRELQGSAMPARFPDGTPILYKLDSWSTDYARRTLGDKVQLVGGLERPMPLHGRPQLIGERYLAQVRGPHWQLGLPDRAPDPYFRLFIYADQKLVANERFAAEASPTLLPNGLEALVHGTGQGWSQREVADAAALHLKELYHSLYASNPQGDQLRYAAGYLLEVLAKANQVNVRPLPPWEILNGKLDFHEDNQFVELNRCVDLETLIRMAYLPTVEGDHVSVHQLATEPWPELDLTERELRILKAFLFP